MAAIANTEETRPKKVKGALKTYTVVKGLRHDGKHYNAGVTVKLDDKEAAPLLKLKVIEGPTTEKAS